MWVCRSVYVCVCVRLGLGLGFGLFLQILTPDESEGLVAQLQSAQDMIDCTPRESMFR